MVQVFENEDSRLFRYFEVKEDVIEISDSLEFHINVFLQIRKNRKEQSYRDALGDLNFLAKHLFKKAEYRYLQVSDFENMDINTMVHFFSNMRNMISEKTKKPFAKATIGRRMSTLKELYKHLSIAEVVNYNLAQLKFFLKIKTDESEEYDILTLDESLDCIEYFKTFKSGEEMHLIGKVGLETGLRAQEILKLQWKNFKDIGDNRVQITSNGKERAKGSKKFAKLITLSFYNELLKIKKAGNNNVFSISYSTVRDNMKKTVTHLKLNEDGRNIVFHSIRKSAVTFVKETTGDITVAQKFAGHKSLDTTMKYVKVHDLGIVGYYGLSEGLDEKVIEEATKEQLLEVIKNNKMLKFIFSKELSNNVENDKM